jgi:hypothetical protein
MRRTVLRIGGAVLLAIGAMTIVARNSAQPATPSMTTVTPFTVSVGTEARIPATAPAPAVGQMASYSGDLPAAATGSLYFGNYRATCVWLGPEVIKGQTVRRVDCTVLLRLYTGTLVAQGQVEEPVAGKLFDGYSEPQLAITGGTGQFKAATGWIDVTGTALTIEVIQSW